MFKLFGKKKETQEEARREPEQQSPELAALAARFGGEEFDIMAVTGANGFGGRKESGRELWLATLPITAWREEGGPIHREDTCLIALADDTLMGFLRRMAPRDSIIQVRVRQGLEDGRFLLAGMPSPVTEPELKAILDEQTKPVSTWVDGLGTFVLNRSVNWFQAEGEWLGQSVQLTYNQAGEEEMRGAQETGHALMADQTGWDARLRAFAAQALLEQARQWAAEYAGEEEGEQEELTGEALAQAIEPEAIHLQPDGSFTFWFNGGELFWGHSMRVEGDLKQGPALAAADGEGDDPALAIGEEEDDPA